MRRKALQSLEEQIAPPHTAILVVDMQNTFFAEESNLGDKDEKRALIPRLKQFIDKARARHLLLVFIRMVQTTDDAMIRMKPGPNRRRGGRGNLTPGSWGADFLPEIQPQTGDILIEKTRFNAFLNTPLDARLRSRGILTIVTTGVYTNVCVGMTACDGSMRNYYTVIPKDLVVGTTPNLHDGALANIERFFGTVTNSDNILQIWNGNKD